MVTIEEFVNERRKVNEEIKRIREKGKGRKLISVLKEDGWDISLIENNERASFGIDKGYSVCININETEPLFAHAELYHKVGRQIEQDVLDKSYDRLIEITAALEVVDI